MGIKRLKPADIDMLRIDVRNLLEFAEEVPTAFKIQRPEDIFDGTLHRHGTWKETNGRVMSGIHTLIANGVQIQMSVICAAIVTEQITFAMMERDSKKKAVAARRKSMMMNLPQNAETEQDSAQAGAMRSVTFYART
jgi:hypothetical protein